MKQQLDAKEGLAMITGSSNRPRLFLRRVSATGFLFLLAIPIASFAIQRTDRRELEVALEITLPNGSRCPVRLNSSKFISRSQLAISEGSAPTDFYEIRVTAKADGDRVAAQITMLFRGSNNAAIEGMTEKPVGSYSISPGESISTPELADFGIEPFEMKIIDARPIVYKPGEGPRVINKTTSLEVAHFEKQLDQCKISLRNRSSKNVLAYGVFWGSTGTRARGRSMADPVIAAGGVSREDYLACSEEADGLTISEAIYDDGTFEGDPKIATEFLVNMLGVGIQAPSILRRIKQALAVDDGDLGTAFDKLEAELWLIPEAIDKQSALDLLIGLYPELDQRKVSELYETLKAGLYDSRNLTLRDLGQTQRSVRELEERGQFVSAVDLMRSVLERLNETFEKIVAARR